MVSNQTIRENDLVLFVCIGNAGRSQMAEAFARSFGFQASSAGTNPAPVLNPMAVQVMKESGIDMSKHRPKRVTSEMIRDAELVVTMGCSVEKVCPRPMLAQIRKKLIDWDLENPKDKPVERVREIRDDIEKRIKELTGRL